MTHPFTIVSCAFGPQYIVQLQRMKESVRVIYPEVEIFTWVNTLPQGSKPHKVSPYGFKVHAVNHARRQGYDKIIWADTALVFQKEVDPWFELCNEYGVVAAADDNGLWKTCGEKAFKYFGVDPLVSKQKDQRLVGGSLLVFDFANEKCEDIFSTWERAEKDGLFQTDGCGRHDEACMSHALYLNGSRPVPYGDCFYNNVPEPIVTKKHFK